MRKLTLGVVAVACWLFSAGLAVAQPAFQTPYQSILGYSSTMNVWQGTNISVLTQVGSTDPTIQSLTAFSTSASADVIMGQIVGNLDQAYNYYALACGTPPAPFPPNYYINGRSTIASVDVTGGAGYSWIGATGIELQTGTFDTLYNGVAANNQYDQVAFYELGRNFWTFGNQLNGTSIGATSFTTGFAVYMRFQSMNYAGVQGGPYGSWTFPQFEQNEINLVSEYTANPSLNFENTLAVGQGVPGSSLGSTDLFASFLFSLSNQFGGNYSATNAFNMNFWKEVAQQPAATTDQGAIDNFFLAACDTTQQDLSNLFVSQWRWPISSAALLAASEIPVAGNAWNGSASALWSNSGNWSEGKVPANGDTISFPIGAANLTNTNDVLTSVGAVSFKQGGFTVSGNSLTLNGGMTSTGSNNTWNINSTLGGPQNFTSLGTLFTIAGNVNTSGYLLTVNGNGGMLFSGAISGSGGLVKDGNGTLQLGNNSFTGGVVIDSGSVQMSSPNAFGAATSTVTLNGGSIVALQTMSNNIVVTANSTIGNYGGSPHITGNLAINSSATLTYSTGGGNPGWIDGQISGGGNMTWVGGGATTSWIDTPSYIDGSLGNTFSGTFTLLQGTLLLEKPAGVTALAGNVVVGGGSNLAQLEINTNQQIGSSATLTFEGGSLINYGAFLTEGHSETFGSVNLQGYGVLDFGSSSNTNTINFGNSSGNSWQDLLQIDNYGPSTHVYAGSNSSGLTTTQLAQLQFINPGGLAPGTYGGQIKSTGEVVPGTLWAPPSTNPAFQLIPYPASLTPGVGSMNLAATNSIVVSNASLWGLGGILSNEIFSLTGEQLPVRLGTAHAGDIALNLNSSLTGEQYTYNVGSQVQVAGGNYQAIAEGTATLLQSLSGSGHGVTLPDVSISDQPAANTPYRALMVDVSRSYTSINTLEQEVELCRLYKIPYMQLHLTDDQAFTFQTSVPGINGGNTTGTQGDPRTIPVYTNQQLTTLENFANAHGVTIVPEIEMPGHGAQMITQRPDLFSTGWYSGSTLNVANPAAVSALETMVGELAKIFFSSPYIHLGGDEADLSQLQYGYVNYISGQGNGQPTVTPAVRAQWDNKMDQLTTQAIAAGQLAPGSQITDPSAVVRDFTNTMDNYVHTLGKSVIVWESDEMTSTVIPLNKDILVEPFDQYTQPTNYINAGFNLINASWSPLYVVGFDGNGMGSGTVGSTSDTLQDIYNWDKTQFGPFAGVGNPLDRYFVPDSQSSNVLGGMLSLWQNEDGADINISRQRLAAMSERLWEPGSEWSYDDFSTRLTHTDGLLDNLLTTVNMTLPVLTQTWSGTAGTTWSASGNWDVGSAPTDGNALTFAAGAANMTNVNDTPVLHIGLVTFAGGGYNVSGNSLGLDAGITSTGNNTWAIPAALTNPQTFTSLNGTLTVSAPIDNGGNDLTIAGSGNVTFSGGIASAGNLWMTGGGTLTLSGSSTYSGNTTVNSGALVVSNTGGSATGSGTVVINSGALVSGSGVIAGPMNVSGGSLSGTLQVNGLTTVNGGGAISPAGVGVIGTLNLWGGLTIGAGSNLQFDLGTGSLGQADLLELSTGTLTAGAGIALSLNPLAGFGDGTYPLIHYGTFSGSLGDFSYPSILGNNSISLQNDAANHDLELVVGNLPNQWALSSGGTWNTASPNWSYGIVPTGSGVTALLGGNLTSSGTISLASPVVLGSLIFANTTASYTLAGPGSLTLSSSTGGSSLTVSGTHTISAALVLGNGVGVSIPSAGDMLTITSVISESPGPAALTMTGAGTLVLANSNTYSGTTTVAGGTLLLASAAAVQNSTVDLAAGNGLVFAGGITTFTLGGLSDAGNLALVDANGAAVALRVGNNGQSTTYSGNLSGVGGSLTKIGSGTLTLAGSSSYGGGTNINAGQLWASADSNLGSGGISLGGGTLGLSGTSFASAKTVTLGSGAIDVPGLATLSGSIGGGGALTKIDTGTLTVSNTANSYAGGTNLNGGTLNFNGLNSLGAGPIAFNGGALQWAAGQTVDISSRTVTINAGGAMLDTNGQSVTLANPIGNGGSGGLTLIPGATGTITLGGSNSYRGGTTLTNGTLVVGSSAALGPAPASAMTYLHFTGNNSTLALNANLTLTSKENVVIDSGVQATINNYYLAAETNSNQYNLTIPGVVSGGGSILKSNNNGVLYLSGSNTYSGGTVIVGDLNGWNSSNTVEINSDASLGTAPSTPTTNISFTSGYTAQLEFAPGFTSYSSSSALNSNRTIYTSATYAAPGSAGLEVGSNNITLANLITGPGALQKGGAGTLYLTNSANSFGGFQSWSGPINITSDGCLGTAPTIPTENMGEYNATATLQAGASLTLNANRNFGFYYTGGFTLDTQGYTVTWNGQLMSNGNAGTFTKSGSGLLISGGSNAATFTSGKYVVAGGVLRADDGVGISSNNVNLTGGVWETDTSIARGLGSGTAQLQMSGTSGFSAYGNAIAVNLSSGTLLSWGTTTGFNPATLVLNAATANSALNFQNPIDLHGANRTIEVDAAPAYPATLSGNISNSTGTAGLIKTGSGTLVLAGSDNYTGGTTLRGGVLSLGGSAALGTSGTVSFAGGTLQYTASNTKDYTAGTDRFSNAANQAYNLDTNGQTVTLAGSLASSGGSLTKYGDGTLILTGSNSYNGGTTLAGGTLALANSAALGTSGTISFAGGTLQYTASDTKDYTAGTDRFSNAANQAYNLDTNGQTVTLAGSLASNGGSLTKIGNGELILSGVNSYGGGTTVLGGSLVLSSSSSLLAGSSLTVGDPAAFALAVPADDLPVAQVPAVEILPVPEPGTAVIVCVAIACAGLVGRLRKRNRIERKASWLDP